MKTATAALVLLPVSVVSSMLCVPPPSASDVPHPKSSKTSFCIVGGSLLFLLFCPVIVLVWVSFLVFCVITFSLLKQWTCVIAVGYTDELK